MEKKEFNFIAEIIKNCDSMNYPLGDSQIIEIEKRFKEFNKLLNIYLCSKIEGEILLPKKDIKEIYAEINKLAYPKLLK